MHTKHPLCGPAIAARQRPCSRRSPALALTTALLASPATVFAMPLDDGALAPTPANGDAATQLDAVRVVSRRASRVSNGATHLDLDIKDTPQSISTVSSAQMRLFGVDNLNDALRLATGIQVEEWETNRTNYLARGLEIKNTQIDGVGLPNDWASSPAPWMRLDTRSWK